MPEMVKVTKGGKTLSATRKNYEVNLRDRGWRIVTPPKATPKKTTRK